MIEHRYISELISTDDIQPNCANLITCPCGSGKSTAIFEKLLPLARSKNRVLYLIDTVAEKEQLLNRYDTRHYDDMWMQNLSGNILTFDEEKVVIMTYAQFGSLVYRYPLFTEQLDLIVCDEAHKLIDYIDWGKSKIKKGNPYITAQQLYATLEVLCFPYIAYLEIQELFCGTRGNQYTILLSATPDRLDSMLVSDVNRIAFDTPVKSHRTAETRQYHSIYLTLMELPRGKPALCFIEHIKQIKEIEAFAQLLGFRTASIWSPHNKDYPLTAEQEKVRIKIIKEQCIPADIDILFFNRSYETSINIFGDFGAMIVHSSKENLAVQARGRLRADLPLLYVYNTECDDFKIPREFIGRPLSTDDKAVLAKIMNLRNDKRMLLKWPSVKKCLLDKGYTLSEKKIDGRWYAIINYAE